MIFVINLFQVRPPEVVILILLIAGLFSLPASMSVYLARTIAFTNKKLEAQVIEIKELSEKELKAQQINADLKLEREREISAKNEAELRAKAAELQSKAYEAERRMLHAENERKTKELEEARNLQLSLLPKDLPLIKGLDIAVYMETATEVGGDYYDFYENENGELTVLIGDATGHGLNAGTMVTATKSLFNSFASEPDIIETFDKISHSLKRMNFKFLSMCLMLLKFNNGKIKISSAGMPPALVYRKKLRDVEEILIKGMPLGSARSFPYELKEIDVEHGDTILLMSDGLPELFNENKEMFGYKKIREDFIEFGDQTSAEIIDSFKQRMKKWSGDFPLHDDVTMVIIKMN
jgi:serine phosphatase RsbU (regulator of sigma subunit)